MRTIIVGDVHGCRLELEALLDRVAFTTGDRLVFVGDLVARGPDSLGVLDVARRTGAIVVRGNHEQKLLDIRAHTAEDPKYPFGRMHRALAAELRPVDWKLIETSPVFFDLPEHGATVVHAGIVPGTPIETQAVQSPGTLMRIRTVPVPIRKGKTENVLWGERYEGPPQLVFGHNAAPGLQLHPWATGLDTGCVYGGRLTALVLGQGQRVPRSIAAREALLVAEPAQRVWFAASGRESASSRGTDAA